MYREHMHMYMYVHIESSIMCPYKRYPTRTREKKLKKIKRKMLIYVFYEYLVFTSIYII